ncbi:hypothetical protein BDR07DRAFT_1384961 [Suillus spraguei]|nr:hypothetical protein BDR07DRAFT_1384961 [Suillus spraguei]
MQLSVLFSALVSLAILVTALPAPGAISKTFLYHSAKRENLDIDFQFHDLVESKKRDGPDPNILGYLGYAKYGGDVPDSTSSRAIEERESDVMDDIGYGDDGGSGTSGAIEERDEPGFNLVTYAGYDNPPAGGCGHF